MSRRGSEPLAGSHPGQETPRSVDPPAAGEQSNGEVVREAPADHVPSGQTRGDSMRSTGSWSMSGAAWSEADPSASRDAGTADTADADETQGNRARGAGNQKRRHLRSHSVHGDITGAAKKVAESTLQRSKSGKILSFKPLHWQRGQQQANTTVAGPDGAPAGSEPAPSSATPSGTSKTPATGKLELKIPVDLPAGARSAHAKPASARVSAQPMWAKRAGLPMPRTAVATHYQTKFSTSSVTY